VNFPVTNLLFLTSILHLFDSDKYIHVYISHLQAVHTWEPPYSIAAEAMSCWVASTGTLGVI
jgi:hypothetical protein